jgi:hypothetical protein
VAVVSWKEKPMSKSFAPLKAALAVLLISLPVGASAGDIYDKAPRHGSAYDDPRYADIYGDAPVRRYEPPRYAPPPSYGPPRYAERYEPREHSEYDDRSRYYLRPMPGVRRFDGRRYADRGGCVDRRDIRDQLIAEGWRDFNDLEIRGEVALITARRPNGHAYRLKLDRCSGDILHARALNESPYDSYAQRRGAYSY